MGFFSKFENHMEDGLEGAADKMFDAPISPVQISKKAERAMRREKMVGAGKQYAPTLYTILVNPEDDQRLFGYYPTLAGETETYLSARASEQGLLMDGQPLVRFIVDDGLKHGKFDVVAELVSAPIIEQLRQEEMQRYGLNPHQETNAQSQAEQRYAPRRNAARPMQGQQQYGRRRATPLSAQAQSAQAQPYTQPAPYNNAGQAQGARPYAPQQQAYQPQGVPAQRRPQGATPQPGRSAMHTQPAAAAGAGVAGAAAGSAAAGAQARDFSHIPTPGAQAAGVQAAPNPTQIPADQQRTAYFNPAQQAQPTGAAPQPQTLHARLLDTSTNRTYTLSGDRLIIGRSRQSDIVLDDLNASRSHAELRFDPQSGWSITDLGSTNGTLVNDKVITSQRLTNGDRITVGMTDLIFQTE